MVDWRHRRDHGVVVVIGQRGSRMAVGEEEAGGMCTEWIG